MVSLAFAGGLAKGLAKGIQQAQELFLQQKQMEERSEFLKDQIKRDNRRLDQADARLEEQRTRGDAILNNQNASLMQGIDAAINDPDLQSRAAQGDLAAVGRITALQNQMATLGAGFGGQAGAISSDRTLSEFQQMKRPEELQAPQKGGQPQGGQGQPQGGQAQASTQQPSVIQQVAATAEPNRPSDAAIAVRAGFISPDQVELNSLGEPTGMIVVNTPGEVKAIQKQLDLRPSLGLEVTTREEMETQAQVKRMQQASGAQEIRARIAQADSPLRKAMEAADFGIDENGAVESLPSRKDAVIQLAGKLLIETANVPGGPEAAASMYRADVLAKLVEDPEGMARFYTTFRDPLTGLEEFVPNPFKMPESDYLAQETILAQPVVTLAGAGSQFRAATSADDVQALRADALSSLQGRINQWSPNARVREGATVFSEIKRSLRSSDLPQFLQKDIVNGVAASARLVGQAVEASGGELNRTEAAELKAQVSEFYQPVLPPGEDFTDRFSEVLLFQRIPEIERMIDSIFTQIDAVTVGSAEDQVNSILERELREIDPQTDFFTEQRRNPAGSPLAESLSKSRGN